MLFSIIIPTYKRHSDLIACLDKLAPSKQAGATLTADLGLVEDSADSIQYEIVVSDDGDVSETREKIGERAAWTRVVQGPRKGPAANRNNAVVHSKGKWLAFTDDDCLPSENWLKSYAEAITEETFVLEGQTITDSPSIGIFSQAPTNYEGGFLWSCNMVFRKDIFDELGGFDEEFPFPHMEDVDLRVRLEKSKGQYPFVPEAIILHPQRIQKPGWTQAKRTESNFYFAKKHEMSLYNAGFGLKFVVRVPLKRVFKEKFGLQTFEYLFRLAFQWAALLPLSMYWKFKYKI